MVRSFVSFNSPGVPEFNIFFWAAPCAILAQGPGYIGLTAVADRSPKNWGRLRPLSIPAATKYCRNSRKMKTSAGLYPAAER
jgi:hypothetical protein